MRNLVGFWNIVEKPRATEISWITKIVDGIVCIRPKNKHSNGTWICDPVRIGILYISPSTNSAPMFQEWSWRITIQNGDKANSFLKYFACNWSSWFAKESWGFLNNFAFVLQAESTHAKIMICAPQIRVFLERIVSLKHTWCAQKTMRFEKLANTIKSFFGRQKYMTLLIFQTPRILKI